MTVINFPGGELKPVEKSVEVIEPAVAPEFFADNVPFIDVWGAIAKLSFSSMTRDAYTGRTSHNVALRVTIPVAELRMIGEKLIEAADQTAAKT